MAVQVFWDANFTVKSLEPKFEDGAGLPSPIAMAPSTPVSIQLPENTKSVQISRDPDSGNNKLKVEVSKTAVPGPAVAENGNIIVDLDNGDAVLSTEGLTYLIITNQEAASRDIDVTYFTS